MANDIVIRAMSQHGRYA